MIMAQVGVQTLTAKVSAHDNAHLARVHLRNRLPPEANVSNWAALIKEKASCNSLSVLELPEALPKALAAMAA